MLSLFDFIRDLPGDRAFLYDDQSCMTYGELFERTLHFVETHAELKGMSCAIISESKKQLAIALPGLSKICKTLYLQPDGLNAEYVDQFYQEIGIDFKILVTKDQLIIEKQANNKSRKTGSELFLLSTSGTTGLPKVFGYSLERLMHKAKVNIDRGNEFNWGLTYDLNRFAGLQVYIQALASGSAITPLRSCLGFAGQVAVCNKYGVNAISATPSFWRQFMMAPNASKLDLKVITLGGEIADQQIISVLSKTFIHSKIVHIYASTEAGVGFSVRDRLAGFSIDEIHRQNPDISLKVISGLLHIKSQSSAETVVSGGIDITEDGYINTGDLVELKGDRYFFLGRESGMINVGGNKVLPEVIEMILNLDHDVKISRVYPKNNPILGSLVCAEIVLTDNDSNQDEIKTRLKAVCRKHLPSYMVPVFITVVNDIAITSTGKMVRNSE